MYIVVRNDLSSAQMCVQSCHAAIEAARKFLVDGDDHPHLVLCEVSGEKKLLQLAEKLDSAGIRWTFFRESDRNNEVTALATEPIFGAQRYLMHRHQLLRSR